MIKKGDELELKIESLAYGARGVSRIDDFVIFVDGGIPGQTVKAFIYKKRKGYGEARIIDVLDQSPYYVAPRCEHFDYCGGCKVQHLDYTEQVHQKQKQVADIFRRLAGIKDIEIDQTVSADPFFHYRNKMEFTFSNRRWLLPNEPENTEKDFALGLHIPKRFDKILDIHECHIQQPLGNEILNAARTLAKEYKLKPYDVRTHIGFLRHLVLKFGVNTNQVMVNIVTSYENTDLLQPLVDGLLEKFPMITSIVNNVNTRKGDTAHGEFEILLFGTPSIEEKMGDRTFEISANSFFQTNSLQGNRLYEIAMEGAQLTGKEVLYDLYCGTGTIGIFMAKYAKEVHGFEVIVSAIEDATRNAVSNGVGNAFFHKANLDTFFTQTGLVKKLQKPDVIIVDPPRAGMHENTTKHLIKFGAKRIVYISCNPTTQARDTQILLNRGYSLSKLTVVDMFPHTAHVETVAVFSKSSK